LNADNIYGDDPLVDEAIINPLSHRCWDNDAYLAQQLELFDMMNIKMEKGYKKIGLKKRKVLSQDKIKKVIKDRNVALYK
jgi:hypothetical protein